MEGNFIQRPWTEGISYRDPGWKVFHSETLDKGFFLKRIRGYFLRRPGWKVFLTKTMDGGYYLQRPWKEGTSNYNRNEGL